MLTGGRRPGRSARLCGLRVQFGGHRADVVAAVDLVAQLTFVLIVADVERDDVAFEVFQRLGNDGVAVGSQLLRRPEEGLVAPHRGVHQRQVVDDGDAAVRTGMRGLDRDLEHMRPSVGACQLDLLDLALVTDVERQDAEAGVLDVGQVEASQNGSRVVGRAGGTRHHRCHSR